MEKFFKNLIQNMLAAYFVITIVKGITIPSNTVYLIATLVMLSITVFLSTKVLKFLTIKLNFITRFLMTAILSLGVFYILEAFMPGFKIGEYTFEGLNSGQLVIHSFQVTPILTMIFGSVIFSFISSILQSLEKSS